MILVKDSKNVNVIFVNLSYSYIYIYIIIDLPPASTTKMMTTVSTQPTASMPKTLPQKATLNGMKFSSKIICDYFCIVNNLI